MMTPFTLDGRTYNVAVTALTRKFSVLDTDQTGRTQDGNMYRDIIGTYYNYEMTVQPKNNDPGALDALWDALSQPVASHVCTFPYNQTTMTQTMYVTSGEQPVHMLYPNKTEWGEIKFSFIAMSPRLTP